MSITAFSTQVGATDVTYTVEFTIGVGNPSTIAGQGDVVIVFPAEYDVSGASFVEADSTLKGSPIVGECTEFGVSGQELRLLDFTQVPAVGTRFVLKFEGIDNLVTPGNQSLGLRVWQDSPGGAVGTNGSGSIMITGPVLDGFQVAAPGGSPIGPKTAGSSFQVEVTALDDSGDPFADLDDAAFSVDITILGSAAGSSGLGTVTLDFSAGTGSATHQVTLGAARSAQTITVTSDCDPYMDGLPDEIVAFPHAGRAWSAQRSP